MKISPKSRNISTEVFSRLTAIKLVERKRRKDNGSYREKWLCKCLCGNKLNVEKSNLIGGHTQSCGCLQSERTANANYRHGFSPNKNEQRFYRIWCGILYRCNGSKNHVGNNKRYYLERGIQVCKRWLKFENFRDDMYESYLKHTEEHGVPNTSIDRIDSFKHYNPKNCRWATRQIQALTREQRIKSGKIKV